MKRFQLEHTQKSCNLYDNCVGLPTHVVLGGGAV